MRRASKENCGAHGRITNNVLNLSVSEHTHAPDPEVELQFNFEEALYNAVNTQRLTPLRVIYDSVSIM